MITSSSANVPLIPEDAVVFPTTPLSTRLTYGSHTPQGVEAKW
jgi:hypothetical protein